MSLISVLYNRVQEFYVPTYIQGTIQLVIDNHPELNHYYKFFKNITVGMGIVKNYETQISLPLKVLEKIIQCPETFEPRSPFFTECIRVKGDLSLMHYFTQLLKRPASSVVATIEQIRSKQYPKMDKVMRVENLTSKMVLNAAINSYPLHGVGSIKWDVINWSLEDLEEKFGKFPLRTNILTGKIEYFSDFIQGFRVTKDKRVYTNGYTIPEVLYEYFCFPFFDNFCFQPAQIWFGKNGEDKKPVTKLHCDFVISFLAQIWGKKKLYLYSPDQHEYLYPLKSYNIYQPCFVDPSNPMYKQYPEFYKAQALEIVLYPGDLLVIPAGWYHCVWALGDTFSISRSMQQEIAKELQNQLDT